MTSFKGHRYVNGNDLISFHMKIIKMKMSTKEINNENASKVNTIGDNLYTIHTTQIYTNKYMEHDRLLGSTTIHNTTIKSV